jgi:23S rRNA A2030 N6-methylase RlmJ
MADTPVLEISVSPSDRINSINASILLGLPVNSKIKLDKVTSNVLALNVSAILRASTLLAPSTTNLTSANSLLINGPYKVKSLTILTGTILNN